MTMMMMIWIPTALLKWTLLQGTVKPINEIKMLCMNLPSGRVGRFIGWIRIETCRIYWRKILYMTKNGKGTNELLWQRNAL
jgi:hypothetical protein